MARTQIKQTGLEPSIVTTIVEGSSPKITAIQVTDNTYTLLDDTAVSLDGGYIKITGSGFSSGCQVLINNTPAASVAFINNTQVHAQVAANVAGTYIVYLVNTNGGVAIAVNGLTYSATPTWVTATTLTSANSGSAYSLQLNATGATSYTLAAGSSLPTGLTLSSSGLLSGTVTVGSSTNFNFTINATDAELQDSPRTFTLGVLVNVVGQQAYTTAGTYSWTAPAGVTSVGVVCVGGGGAGHNNWWGGSGGGLGWKNNISVTPGQSYTVVVGAAGNHTVTPPTDGNSSFFINTSTVAGLGGLGGSTSSKAGGGFVGDGGGAGGSAEQSGGGAGGYSGAGGAGQPANVTPTTAGNGGGAGGGSLKRGGGGVGILGQGTSGAVRSGGGGGAGGSGGTQAADDPDGGGAGLYGGGGGGGSFGNNTQGKGGAVRIIWGTGRAFPATNTADQ
jgi:hypothetical protein